MGAHRLIQRLSLSLITCAFFAPILAVASSDNGSLIAGTRATIFFCMVGPLQLFYSGNGYLSGAEGAYAPTGLTGGKTVFQIEDLVHSACTSHAELGVEGFTSNPGQSWLTSIECNGVTLTGSSATFTYDSSTGAAGWAWSSKFGFSSGSGYSCTINHS